MRVDGVGDDAEGVEVDSGVFAVGGYEGGVFLHGGFGGVVFGFFVPVRVGKVCEMVCGVGKGMFFGVGMGVV